MQSWSKKLPIILFFNLKNAVFVKQVSQIQDETERLKQWSGKSTHTGYGRPVSREPESITGVKEAALSHLFCQLASLWWHPLWKRVGRAYFVSETPGAGRESILIVTGNPDCLGIQRDWQWLESGWQWINMSQLRRNKSLAVQLILLNCTHSAIFPPAPGNHLNAPQVLKWKGSLNFYSIKETEELNKLKSQCHKLMYICWLLVDL